jgi:16S rRNA processing protein RimM
MAHARIHVPKLARKWVTVGVVLRPFGRNGEMKVQVETDFPERFEVGARLYWWKPPLLAKKHEREAQEEPKRPRERTTKPQECYVTGARWQQDTLLLTLEGVVSIEQAEELRGAWLMIPPEERMPLEEGEYYISDLIGMTVYTEDGNRLGLVKKITQTAAYDLYEVGSHLIPAVKEFVLKIDMKNRRMIVRLPAEES